VTAGVAFGLVAQWIPEDWKPLCLCAALTVGALSLVAWIISFLPQVQRFRHSPKGKSPMAYLLAAVLGALIAIIAWHAVSPKEEQEGSIATETKDRQLIEEAEKASREILEFISDRDREDPIKMHASPEEFIANAERSLARSTETRNMYIRKFAPTVRRLVKEFKKRGILGDRIDHLASDAVNPLGIKDVGVELGTMAQELMAKKK
jgi:uncharacterized membrane protein YeaQ/YmgE (transglycosylase-associated protein family)